MKSKQKYILSWPKGNYQPDFLRTYYNEKELRKEYTRLRDIAQKRIQRLGKSEFKDTQTYKTYSKGFLKLSQIKNESELATALSELAGFVGAKTSTVTGLKEQRRAAINSLHEHGYDFVNEENFEDFTDFMDDYRTKKLNHIYDSERVAKLFNTAEDKGIESDELYEDFEFWMENEEKLATIELPPNKKESAANYRKAINQTKQRQHQKSTNKQSQKKPAQRRGSARRK